MEPEKGPSDVENENGHRGNSFKSSQCLACGKSVLQPKEENRLGEEIICDSCHQEMIASLEAAWVKHSAFLDSALN